MKRLVALALGLVAVAAVTTPAAAWGVGVPQQTSVFPTYRDPWASWGRHPHTTVVVPAPEVVVTPGVVGVPVVRQPVWCPGQWAWTGFSWVWIPGHWAF